MRIVIDTCSLVALCRYYLSFDKERALYYFFKEKMATGEIIIIDKVLSECYGVSDKIVIKSLTFLTDKHFTKSHRIPYDTSTLVAPNPGELFYKIDTEFANLELIKSKGLNDTQYLSQRDRFIKSADMTQVILCLRMKESGIPIALVTEETVFDNDNKLFKKIPFMCSRLDITPMTLAEYISKSEGLEIIFRKKGYSTELIQPICFKCKHIIPLSGCCQAFQNGIPRIVLESNSHNKPIGGQNNSLVYTPN